MPSEPCYAGEVVFRIPDDAMNRLLDDAFRWYHTNSDRSPVYGKSEDEKLAYCLNQVIGIASFGRIRSLEEIGAEVRVKR